MNRVPYPGHLSYKELDPLDTFNYPMLVVEEHILQELHIPTETLEYLHHNQRMVNRIYSAELGGTYYVLQVSYPPGIAAQTRRGKEVHYRTDAN